MLRNLVKQLATFREEPGVQEALVRKYEEKRQSGFSSAVLSRDESKNLLRELVQSHQRTTLIIDALYECSEDDTVDLIQIFDQLVKDTTNLKILISSRRNHDIKKRLETKINLGIEATDNAEDIREFVGVRLREGEERRLKPFSEPLRKKSSRRFS